MKVKKVIIDGFHNASKRAYSFDDINYLFGKNGAGKSTVLQAIQLGLLGYVPGTNKTKQGVFTHANDHTMSVKVILDDDGQEISILRIWTRVKASVTERVEITPDGYPIENLVKAVELPLFNFDEFSHMTANTLKDWFINYLPKQEFDVAWKAQLTSSVKDLPENVVDSQLIDESVDAISKFNLRGVEEVRQANTYFKNQLSFMKSELQRKTATIQSLVHYDDYTATYTEDELKALISSKEHELVQASLTRQNNARATAIRQQMASLEDADKLANQKLEEIKTTEHDVDSTSKIIRSLESNYQQLLADYRSYDRIIKSAGVCTFTGKECEEIVSLRDTYLAKQAELSASMNELSDDLYRHRQDLADATNRLNSIRNQVSQLQYDARRYDQLKRELDSIPNVLTIPDVNEDELNEQLEQYKIDYGKAVANRQYNELSSIIIRDKYRIEHAIECLKVWVKLTDVNGLQASGDYNPFDLLADNVDSVLQRLFNSNKVRVKFVSEGKANSFSFGVIRDDSYVPYVLLSSGEKCLFVLALFIGLMEYNNSPLKLILIDDFLDHLDDDNFKAIFTVLKEKTDIQYIFAGVKPVVDENINIINIA